MRITEVGNQIIQCTACPRLRKHCLKTASERRRSFQDQEYWGKPITGFGDPKARLMLVGLAPAAHGANRTGRIFTGDRSGDWLFRALHRAGFANQPHSTSADDGLQLKDAYVSCVVKCAPPDNRPTPAELDRCIPFLQQELSCMKQVRVWIALGQIGYHGLWPLLSRQPGHKRARPAFGHGKRIDLAEGKTLLLSYHPSQQNTFTGRLTEVMFDSVFEQAKTLLQK